MKKIICLAGAVLFSAAIAFSQELQELDAENLEKEALKIEFPSPVPLLDAVHSPAAVSENRQEIDEIVTITGLVNRSRANVAINKTAMTVTGGVNRRVINLKIDPEAGTISGGANLTPIRLKFTRGENETTVEGAANLSPTKYSVNWEKGLLEGYTCLSPLKLQFDMQGSEAGPETVVINGYVNRMPVRLQFDKKNGVMTGHMNYHPVNLKMEFSALRDFFEYFFLFAKDNTETSND